MKSSGLTSKLMTTNRVKSTPSGIEPSGCGLLVYTAEFTVTKAPSTPATLTDTPVVLV